MTTYSVNLIADYFIFLAQAEDGGELLSNLKIQKLCYYAAGTIAALRNNIDDPLFCESIEAWQHGPVVSELYHRFKEFGANGIDFTPSDECVVGINAKDRDVLDDVFSYYGQYSAWKLRDMTHEESPWIDAFNNHNNDTRITTQSLYDFFKEEVTDEYIQSYND